MSTETNNKKTLFIAITIAIIVVIGIIFYLFNSGILGEDKTSQNKKAIDESQFILDVEVLKTSFFESLRRYGSFPIKIRRAGRKNPFEPYE